MAAVQAKKGLSLGSKKADAINADNAQVLHSVLSQAETRAASAAAAEAAGKKAKKLEPDFAAALSKLREWLAQAEVWYAGYGGGSGGAGGGGFPSRKRSCRADESNAGDNDDNEDDDDDDDGNEGHSHGGGSSGSRSRGGDKGQERGNPSSGGGGKNGGGDDHGGLPPPTAEMLKDWKYHVHLIRKIKTAQARCLKEELETAIELAIDEPSVNALMHTRSMLSFGLPEAYVFALKITCVLGNFEVTLFPTPLTHTRVRMFAIVSRD